MHCTENSEISNKMDEKEVTDLCCKNQTKTSELHDGEESTKQESQYKMKSKSITRLESKNWPEKYKQMAESEEIETAMMCWEHLEDSPGKQPYKEIDDKEKKPVEEMKNQKMKKNMTTLHYIWATE